MPGVLMPGSADIVDDAMAYTIRAARTSDVPVVRKLIDSNVESGRLLSKADRKSTRLNSSHQR